MVYSSTLKQFNGYVYRILKLYQWLSVWLKKDWRLEYAWWHSFICIRYKLNRKKEIFKRQKCGTQFPWVVGGGTKNEKTTNE